MTFGDLWPMMTSRQFWATALKAGLLAALATTILLTAFATFLVVLPFALVSGPAVHLFLRRKLRHGRRQTSSRLVVIDGEYTVLDR